MRALYDSKSKTIDHDGMKDLFTKEARLQSWLDLEAALAKAQGEVGMIPAEAAKNIAENAKLDRIDLEEIGSSSGKNRSWFRTADQGSGASL